MTVSRPSDALPPGQPEVDDGLGVAAAFGARHGAGARTALVLGGGGIVFVSWQLAYLYRLHQLGVNVGGADIVVGTSAGSVVASVLTGGHLARVHAELGLLTRVPALVAMMAPAGELAPSQRRAAALFLDAGDSAPSTVRAIGHAALAAATPGPDLLPRSLRLLLPSNRWPADGPVTGRLRITATDTYSGQRLVLTRASGVGLRRAVAASATVPGLFAPQPVRDRRAMDGGVSGSGTHCDLVAGAGRALVLSLFGGRAQAASTQQPGTLQAELDKLRRSGTVVEARHTGLPASVNLMDPACMGDAVADGRAQAERDVETMSALFAT
jgi:NTE family protein